MKVSEKGQEKDERLREAILDALEADVRTDEAGLRVGVFNAIAHLGGAVKSPQIRETAEAIASRTAGLQGVVNRIEAPGAPSPGRSIEIQISRDSSRGETDEKSG